MTKRRYIKKRKPNKDFPYKPIPKHLVWLDAQSQSGWLSKEQMDSIKPAQSKTKGWIYEETQNYIKTFGTYSIDSEDGSIVIERQRLKTGIPKTVTLSKELSNIFGRLKGKATEFFKKRKDDLASSYKSFFNAEDGHTIYHSDIKSIWYNFFPKKGKGGRDD